MGIAIDKSTLYDTDYPEALISEEGVSSGYNLHGSMWGNILHTAEIVDGLVDTNGVSSMGKNGQPLTPSINIGHTVVLRNSDPLLKFCYNELIPYLKQITEQDEQVKKISQFINFIGKNELGYDSAVDEKNMLLGEVFKNNAAVCRHKGLIFKILCDELGITNGIRCGFSKTNNDFIRHCWNEVEIDGEWYVIDNSYRPTFENFKYNQVPDSYFIRVLGDFVSLESIGEGNL